MITKILKAISDFFHKILAWIWISSSDPTKVSLTVKSSLMVAATALMQVIGLTHLNLGIIDAAFLNTFVNDVTTAVTDILMAVGAIGAVVGGVTKAWTSISGKNPVINGTVPSPSV